MKITTLQGTYRVNQSGQKDGQPLSGADFKQLLEAQLQSVASATPATNVTPAAALQVPPALRLESLTLAETTMNSLASFGEALGDLSLPGESLLPFVESLEEETSSLLSLKEQLPTDDPLARLLDRVASVSYVETAKFRRGDYQ